MGTRPDPGARQVTGNDMGLEAWERVSSMSSCSKRATAYLSVDAQRRSSDFATTVLKHEVEGGLD